MDRYRKSDGRVVVAGESLKGRDFSGTTGRHWFISDSRFENCSFENQRIVEFCFGSGKSVTEYVDCSFDGSRIGATVPGMAVFVRCSFKDVRLTKWICDAVEMYDCEFSGVIKSVVFDRRVGNTYRPHLSRATNTYVRNSFVGAELRDVSFRGGIDLGEQILPERAGYFVLKDAVDRLPEALAAVREWPDEAARVRAVSFLEVMMGQVETGQRDILFSPDSWKSRSGTLEAIYRDLLDVLRTPGRS